MATKSKKIFQCLMAKEKKDQRVNMDFFKELKTLSDSDRKKITLMQLGGGTMNIKNEYFIKRIY